MSNPSVTPGPWFAASQLDQLYVIAGRPPSTNDDHPWHDANRTVIAKICTDSELDAQLIASAPFMAEEVDRLKQYERVAGILAVEKAEQRRRAENAEKRIAELESQPADQFTAELVEIDGHTYGLRPGAARVVREALRDAGRYRWLRSRDLDVIETGGVFAGMTPDNVALSGNELDEAIDAAMAKDGA